METNPRRRRRRRRGRSDEYQAFFCALEAEIFANINAESADAVSDHSPWRRLFGVFLGAYGAYTIHAQFPGAERHTYH